MTFATVQAAIAFARAQHQAAGSEAGIGLSFYGGEPLLLRELIAETIRYCRHLTEETGQSFHFKITTNGLLLDEAFLTDPLTGEIFVALSHDGIAAAHDAHRCDGTGLGSFARLDGQIDLLLSHKPYAPVMMTVTPETVRHYAESVAYLHARGFRYLICALNFAGAWDEAALRELTRQYRKLATWYERETMRESKFYFSPFEAKIASHITPGSCRAGRCDFGRRQISVAPNGRLYPCVQFVDDGSDTTYAIGHATTGIDEEARARVYTMNAVENNDCAGCAIRERCNHYCGCLNKQATGRIDTVAPLLCAHERIVLPIADALAAKLFKRRNPLFIQKHYNELYPLLSLVEDRTEGKG